MLLQLRIKPDHAPFRRAGLLFTSIREWTEVEIGYNDERRFAQLLADTGLTIEAQQSNGEWRAMPPSARAAARTWLATGDVDEASLAQLAEALGSTPVDDNDEVEQNTQRESAGEASAAPAPSAAATAADGGVPATAVGDDGASAAPPAPAEGPQPAATVQPPVVVPDAAPASTPKPKAVAKPKGAPAPKVKAAPKVGAAAK